MREHCRLAPALLAAASTGLLACASLDRSSSGAVGSAPDRVAIAPVTLAPGLQHRAAGDPTRYADAATHVGHYLAEALLDRGVEVVPARDSGGTLGGVDRSPDLHRDASRLARVAAERLGVDSLLVVEVTRWSPHDALERPPAPAAVGFRATLHGGADGLLLWSGGFSERQASFIESPWRSLRYPGWGTRWLSVTELARWGARRLAREIPVHARAP